MACFRDSYTMMVAVIEAMDIPKVVEARINTFDVAYTEEIILSLAKKELICNYLVRPC